MKPLPTVRDGSTIFSRAFLRRDNGTVVSLDRSRDSGPTRVQEAPPAPVHAERPPARPVYLSSSRTSRTVWPVTTNTSDMSSVSILQE